MESAENTDESDNDPETPLKEKKAKTSWMAACSTRPQYSTSLIYESQVRLPFY
jgi:hypothetical protein